MYVNWLQYKYYNIPYLYMLKFHANPETHIIRTVI